MYLIAGLGNPGISYQKSRHNAGFWAIDAFASECGISIVKRAHRSLLGEGFYKGEKLILAKPQTYMNLSGEAVQSIMHFYKLPIERLVVLYDDVELAPGALRIRAAGSAGTHNGMRSIITCLGGQDFSRVRIGVGRQEQGRDLAAHVLGRPSEEEQKRVDQSIKNAVDALRMIVEGDLAGAQAKYNQKPREKADEDA